MKKILRLNRCIILLMFTLTIPLEAQWVRTNDNFKDYVRYFAVNDTILFAGTWEDGVLRTTDYGNTWTYMNNDTMDVNVMALAAGSNGTGGINIFAGTLFGGVYISTNNGINWTSLNNGLTGNGIRSLFVNSIDSSISLFSVDIGGGVYRSTNDGNTWTAINNGFDPPYAGQAANNFASFSTSIYVATGYGVFASTNNGTNWTAINNGLTNLGIRTIAACSNEVGDTILLAGTFTRGIFRSTNSGRSWEPSNNGLTNKVIYCFALAADLENRTNIFLGLSGSAGVYRSTDFGESWIAVVPGLTTQFEPTVFALSVCGKYLFAGTSEGVWRCPINALLTDVENKKTEISTNFSLEQNYPNPFNPATTIQYAVGSGPVGNNSNNNEQLVTLKVYDMLGREITTLVNEEKKPGNYKVTFNSSKYNLSSGVYFYRIQTGEFSQTRKFILQK